MSWSPWWGRKILCYWSDRGGCWCPWQGQCSWAAGWLERGWVIHHGHIKLLSKKKSVLVCVTCIKIVPPDRTKKSVVLTKKLKYFSWWERWEDLSHHADWGNKSTCILLVQAPAMPQPCRAVSACSCVFPFVLRWLKLLDGLSKEQNSPLWGVQGRRKACRKQGTPLLPREQS